MCSYCFDLGLSAYYWGSHGAKISKDAAPQGFTRSPRDFSAKSAVPRGEGVERGVESRERARFFGPGLPVRQKERANFPSKISTPGKFCVPARHPTREGLTAL